jgi:hypothetical protein
VPCLALCWWPKSVSALLSFLVFFMRASALTGCFWSVCFDCLFHAAFAMKTLDGDNQYFCEKCDEKCDAMKVSPICSEEEGRLAAAMPSSPTPPPYLLFVLAYTEGGRSHASLKRIEELKLILVHWTCFSGLVGAQVRDASVLPHLAAQAV